MPRIEVNYDRCIGSAVCRATALNTFDVEDDQCVVLDPEGDPLERILEAAERCPTQALTVYDDEGRRLFPR